MEAASRCRGSHVRRLIGPALFGLVALSLLIGGSVRSGGVAHAATGDPLREITAATPPCGVGVGIAFDGTHLIVDCYQSASLWLVSPTDGSLVDTKSISGISSIDAISWDQSRGELWACDDIDNVYLIDLTAQTATLKFASNGCFDGLAYDGSDGTIWASCDACNDLYHYSTSGAVLGHFTGMYTKLGGSGNSGIAVGGDKLYLANDGGSQIYQCTKDLVTCNLMSAFPRRLEGLACDNVTFAPLGAIWSIDAYDRTLNAWEIPAGTCAFGGAPVGQPTAPVLVRSATPTSSPTAPATDTPVPATSTPVPTNTSAPPPPAQPTATSPGGGTAGVITGPNTGSGPGGSGVPWALIALSMMLVSGGAVLSTAALRARRR